MGGIPEEADIRRWVQTWQKTGPIIDALRRAELKGLDSYQALRLLTGTVDFSQEPFKPKPSSGLIEQQAWFRKVAA